MCISRRESLCFFGFSLRCWVSCLSNPGKFRESIFREATSREDPGIHFPEMFFSVQVVRSGLCERLRGREERVGELGRVGQRALRLWPSPVKDSGDVPDAVSVYRKVLAAAEDHSIVISSIGFHFLQV